MKQVFILNVAEQAALTHGYAQVLRLADGSEFEFRFERAEHAESVNGTRPRRRSRPPLDASNAAAVLDAARARKSVQNRLYRARKAARAGVAESETLLQCPKCPVHFTQGRAMHQHLRSTHKLSASARYKLFPAVRKKRATTP